MKYTELKNEDALDVLADILEPTALIFADDEVTQAYRSLPKIKVAQIVIKKHKKEIIEILAGLDRVPVEEFECGLLTLPVRVIEILNDKELASFFSSAALTNESASSCSVTENTKDGGE